MFVVTCDVTTFPHLGLPMAGLVETGDRSREWLLPVMGDSTGPRSTHREQRNLIITRGHVGQYGECLDPRAQETPS